MKDEFSVGYGGSDGSVTFSLKCCQKSGCNWWNEETLHSEWLPKLCNYSNFHEDPSHILPEFKKYCQSLGENTVGPFTPFEFILLLTIPIVVALFVLICIVVYTKRVHHCSLPAWKHFLVHLCTVHKCCWIGESHQRSHSRNSDISQQQHLLEVTTLNNQRSGCQSPTSFSPLSSLGKKGSVDSAATVKTVFSTVSGSHNLRMQAATSFSTPSSGVNGAKTIFTSDYATEETTSGSGSGVPSLGKVTLAYQIQLGPVIGMGRYGTVHRGEMFGDHVAVKVFHSRHERAWLRERQIYITHGMQHEHILAFRGADTKDTGITTELWLVTEYHAHGSLYDYLEQRTVNLQQSLKLISSLVAGLSHLHLEISGSPGKPAIAHRDLKSRNILVKANHQCCLADFGFAVTFLSQSDKLEQSEEVFIGTRRYMSNELLDRSFDPSSFSAFAATDLYALGIILWEILRRTELHNEKAPADSFQPPYMEFGIANDPTIEEMKQLVCEAKQRPTVPERFATPINDLPFADKDRQIVSTLGELIKELWQEVPLSRPSALQVKKTLLRYYAVSH